MILYHVTKDLTHDGKFTPRIPEFRTEHEDKTIPRVSTAITIEDCLAAIPFGGMNLDYLVEEEGYEFKVFMIDTEKLNIKEESLVSSEMLYKKDLVRDAGFTNEYWITESFEVPDEDVLIIEITNFDYESVDVIPYEIYKKGINDYDGDYVEAFVEKHGHDMMPCGTKIINLEYLHKAA